MVGMIMEKKLVDTERSKRGEDRLKSSSLRAWKLVIEDRVIGIYRN